jgi:hypothetical protein
LNRCILQRREPKRSVGGLSGRDAKVKQDVGM